MRALDYPKTQPLTSFFRKYSKATNATASARRENTITKPHITRRAATEPQARLGCILPLAKCTWVLRAYWRTRMPFASSAAACALLAAGVLRI